MRHARHPRLLPRPSRRRGDRDRRRRSPRPPTRATGSCSWSPPGASTARSTTASSTTASRCGERRVDETEQAAEILGVARVEFLGYVDSGHGRARPRTTLPGSFWTADVEEAAARLAAILRDEDAEVLTVYDDHGGYDHPDHIQVHRVGVRAAELAGTPRVYEATINRDDIRRLMIEHARARRRCRHRAARATSVIPRT